MQKTALVFAGQGAQKVGMGKSLAEGFATARAIFSHGDEALGFGLSSICFNGPEAELTKTENAQPGIFLVSWAAFQVLMEAFPSLCFEATAGLSLGEFTALAAAKVFSYEDGLRLVWRRGRFMQEACEVTHGSMAAVLGLDEAATQAICDEAGVALANLNCPGQLVISGESERIAVACELVQKRGGKRALPLSVAGAYHSPLMSSAQPKLEAALAAVTLQAPTVSVLSNVTAQSHGDVNSIRRRLVEQVTSSVRWEESMRLLLSQGFTRFIELGPGSALSGFMKRIRKDVQMLNVSDAESLEVTLEALRNPSPA